MRVRFATSLRIPLGAGSHIESAIAMPPDCDMGIGGLLPEGDLSLALERLHVLIAFSDDFQTWVGAADAVEAAASIHQIAADSPTRPFALIATGDTLKSEAIAGGAQNVFEDSGELFLLFEADVTADLGHFDSEDEFMADIDLIVGDIKTLAGQSGYLSVTDIRLVVGPSRASIEEQNAGDDYYQVIFAVAWGAA